MDEQIENKKSRKSLDVLNAANGLLKIQVLIFIISFIFLMLFDVCFALENITITNIWYKKVANFTRVTIKADRPIENYEAMYVGDPDRIIIDIHQADYNIRELVKNTLFLNMGSVKQVRCGQIEEEKVRFVIDLFQEVDYDMALDTTGHLLQINVYDYREFLSPEQQIFTVEPLSADEIRKIQEQEVELAAVPSLVDQVTTPITLNLKETEVVDVIRTLSLLSGVNIVADDSVSGNITINLADVSFKEALDWILKLKRLSYTQVGNALIIGTPDIIETYKEKITRIVHLENANVENFKSVLDNYFGTEANINITPDTRLNTLIVEGSKELVMKAEALIAEMDTSLITRSFKIDNATFPEEVESIKSMLGIIIPDESRINIDYRQNEIIVKGNQEEIANAETMIQGLDKRAPQIMIESKIVEISLDAEKDLGISWSSGATDEEGVVPGRIVLGEITLGGSFERRGLIQATLDALVREGETNILSNPKILTLDGKKAIILSGSKIPIREITADGIETIRYLDVGLNMTITPRLSMDDKITMDCDIKVESLGTELIQGYPIINSRQEQAIIRSPLGVTNVIGGLISAEEIETIKRIPILSEIPVIGEIFKFRNYSKKRTEIIILITAHRIEY